MMAPEHARAEFGLEDFAIAWLKRWTGKGGDVRLEPESRQVWFGRPEYHFSQAYREDEEYLAALAQNGLAALPEKTRDGFLEEMRVERKHGYEASMRELMDLLDAVPDGIAALRTVLHTVSELQAQGATLQ